MSVNRKTPSFLAFSADLLGYKKSITLINIFCNAIIFSHQAVVNFCVRQILNGLETAPGSAFHAAIPYLAGILVVAIIRVAAIMGCAVLDALRSYYYQNRVRANILRLLLRKEDVMAVAGRSGAIFEVLDADIPIATFPADLLTEVTGYFIYTLIALIMLLSINRQLTLFIFIPLSVAIYGVQRLSQRMKERRRENRMAHDAASSFISDTVDAVLTIKTSGAEEAVLGRYHSVNQDRRGAVLRDTLLNAKIGVLLHGAIYAGAAIIMFAAARLMTSGAFGIGDFSLFIAHLGTLADCVNRIVELVAESRRAEVSYERILSVVGEENAHRLNADAGLTLRSVSQPQPHDYPHTPFTSFEVRNLSFAYGDGLGFSDVSFQVLPGELVVVTGEIASGKSTLLGVLMGLIPADSGEMLLDGELLSPSRREPVGIAGAPQRGGFFSVDLETNLRLGFPAKQEDMARALSIAAFDDTVAGMSQGVSIDLGNRGSRLSGGQQQRLALARMLLRGAQLNIIDDCISALDEDTRMKVLHRLTAYLKQTARGAIVATNERAFLEAADRILYLDHGRVVARGDFVQLMAESAAFGDPVGIENLRTM